MGEDDDFRKLMEHMDEESNGKSLPSLQEGPQEFTDIRFVEGPVASEMEVSVQSLACSPLTERDSMNLMIPINEDSNLSGDAKLPAEQMRTSREINESFSDPSGVVQNNLGAEVDTEKVGAGPCEEVKGVSLLQKETLSLIGASDDVSNQLTMPDNETTPISQRHQAVFNYITPPDFSTLEATVGIPTTGIASGLVGPLVLKDRFNRWIDATAPLARELTSVAAAKAGLSVPGGIKSWLGNTWAAAPGKGPIILPGNPPEEHSSNSSTPSGSKSLSASPVMKAEAVLHVRNASTDRIASNKVQDTSFQDVSLNPDMERGNQLMIELKQSLKIVLGEVVKGNGKPLGDGVYAVTLFCGLLDQALAHGLKDGRPRWAAWSSSKNPPSFLNLLEALEQRLPSEPGPENEDYRGSLGLDGVRSLNWVRTNAGRLRAWIRQSLNSGLLGARLRLVVEHVDLLQQWYEAWGLLRRDETSDELLSVVMALNAVQTNLSVGLGVGLDHQKYALIENLFSLESSKSGNEMVDNGYPVAENTPMMTITTTHIKNISKHSSIIPLFGAEAYSSSTNAPIAIQNIHASGLDALSPPDSPYNSPSSVGSEIANPKEGVELRPRVLPDVDGHEGISGDCSNPADDGIDYLNAMEITLGKEGADGTWPDKQSDNGIHDGDDSSESSMFAVESGDGERKQLLSSYVKQEQLGLNSEADIAYGHNDWADFEQENAQGLDGFQSFFEETKVEKNSSGISAELQVTLAESIHFDAVVGEPVNDVGINVGQVKGSGRPDLDEYEDDSCSADAAEKVSNLSDLEEEEYKSDFGVKNPLNASSPYHQRDYLDEGVADVQHTERNLLGGEESSVRQSAHMNPLPISLDEFTEEQMLDKNSQLANVLSRMSSLSDSDENHLLAPGSDVEEPFSQESRIPMNLFGTFAGDTNTLQSQGDASEATQILQPTQSDHMNLELQVGAGQKVGVGELKEESLLAEKATVKGGSRRKGTIMRLGSKEAEELLQLDFTKMGRAILPLLKKGGAGSKSPHVGAKSPGVASHSGDWGAGDLGPDELSRYVENLEVKETYLDTILDMEDVLLDSDDNHGPRASHPSKSMFTTSIQKFDRDGTLSSSMSAVTTGPGHRNFDLSGMHLVDIAWVEVVGARQQRGGASFSERAVGVQEHTVYRILVRSGNGQEWEVEHRYREFVSLSQQLTRTYAAQSGAMLPSPWDKVRVESRKLFGNTSPNVVEVRSALIQVCLQSLLQAGPPLSNAPPLLRFLFPATWASGATQRSSLPRATSEKLQSTGSQLSLDDFGSEPAFSPRSDSTSNIIEGEAEFSAGVQSVFGKTIRLILQVHKKKPLSQQMHVQHHACAGCYRQLDLSAGLLPSLAQSMGLGGPRWCEYSGQLFCSSCHLNETAVIPAYVLQRWDFGLRPVSQLAKAYLDSIYDKPMLCVSAVNPHLYYRVPILAHLRDTRKRLSKMLSCIRCPSRSRIQAMVGPRRYLLENNDFYALRDLTDLSKGAFAGLPAFMNTLLEKLTAHIKRECSICHDLGESCGAGELCKDSLDIIYPFQEDGVVRCATCRLPFHKICFTVCKTCPSCSGGQSVHILEDSRPNEIATTSNGSLSKESAHASYSTDAGVQVEPSGRAKGKRSNFLSGLLTNKDSSKEIQPRREESVVINMRSLSGPLEL